VSEARWRSGIILRSIGQTRCVSEDGRRRRPCKPPAFEMRVPVGQKRHRYVLLRMRSAPQVQLLKPYVITMMSYVLHRICLHETQCQTLGEQHDQELRGAVAHPTLG